jgi:hypothetical protein
MHFLLNDFAGGEDLFNFEKIEEEDKEGSSNTPRFGD